MQNDELLEKFKDKLVEVSDELSRTNSPNQIKAIDKKLVSLISQIDSVRQELKEQSNQLLHKAQKITEEIDATVKQVKLQTEYLREYEETIDKASRNIFNSVEELANALLDYKRLILKSQQNLTEIKKATDEILKETRSLLTEIDERLANIVQKGIENSLNALERRIYEILYDITDEHGAVAIELKNAKEEFTQEVATLEEKLTESLTKSVNRALDDRLNEFISKQKETFSKLKNYLLYFIGGNVVLFVLFIIFELKVIRKDFISAVYNAIEQFLRGGIQ